jgi:hypothetical protein
MKVRKQLKSWPEKGQRDAIWLPAQDAARPHQFPIAQRSESKSIKWRASGISTKRSPTGQAVSGMLRLTKK